MNDELNWLITVLYGDTLLRVALKIDKWDLPEGRMRDIVDYPMEPENRKAIHAMLPLHVQSCGPIVDVEPLFGIHVRDAAVRLRERDIANATGERTLPAGEKL
jgi:hypothetical protein